MSRFLIGAAVGAALTLPVAADPLAPAATGLTGVAPDYAAAVARIEARVVDFAPEGGIVEQVLAAPAPPDPLGADALIVHVRSSARALTDAVDDAVSAFEASQWPLFEVSDDGPLAMLSAGVDTGLRDVAVPDPADISGMRGAEVVGGLHPSFSATFVISAAGSQPGGFFAGR